MAFYPSSQSRLLSATGYDPVAIMKSAVSKTQPWDSIVDFASHDSFCGQALYPRQLTLLKLMYLETDNMTSFDLEVIEEWRKGFRRRRDVFGVQPDIWERVAYLKARGARRFPHIQAVLGRRASKGFIGGILGAEQIAYFHSLDNWQMHFGVRPGKIGYLNVGATSLTQAKDHQFKDVRDVVESCRYLQPHIAESKDYMMSIRTPADLRMIAEMKAAKIPIEHPIATLEVQALSASSTAGRGATAFGIFLDEFAFMIHGTGSHKSGEEIYEDWMPSLDQFDLDGLTYIPSSPASKVGKAQPLDTKVLTPTGWRRMGDLAVGDLVIGSDGSAVRVTALHPQGMRPVYRVTTTDGASVEASDNHDWTVFTQTQRHKNLPGWTLTTLQLKERTEGNCRHRVSLPRISAPISYSERALPIDPYALGLLLGDGCITQSIIFGSQDKELIEVFRDRMVRDFPECRLVIKTRPGGYIEGWLRSTTTGTKGRVRKELENLKLWGLKSYEKFIPENYLRCSAHQRLEMLRGLLDTDGWCDRGTPVFSTSSALLMQGITDLVEGLGGVCRVRKIYPGKGGFLSERKDYWEVRIRLPKGYDSPFRLARKHAIYAAAESSRAGGERGLVRSVKSVEYVSDKPVQCITVNAPDHLYVTERHLLTHNCYSLYQEASVLMSSYSEDSETGEEAAAELKAMAAQGGNDVAEVVADPTKLVIQLPSWGLYENWEKSRQLIGVSFKRPIQPGPTHESQIRRKLRNPDKFKVEREGQWAEVQGAYFDPDMVERIFDPPSWRPALESQARGYLTHKYRIHCDPGRTGANFALCVGHLENSPADQNGISWPHVVIDMLHVWRPQDFPPDIETGRPTIDYVQVQEEIDDILFRFPSTSKISFDQWNSAGMIASLRRKFSPSIRVTEVTFTEKENQARFERVKSALNLGWVHCLAGETQVLTSTGPRPISELAGGTHRLMTTQNADGRGGGVWVDVPVSSFGTAPLMKVTVRRNGVNKVIHATPNHRWFVQRSSGTASFRDEVLTEHLKPGQKLSHCYAQRHRATRPSPIGIAHGFTFGDGTRSRKGSVAQFCGDKDKPLIPYFDMHPIVDTAPGVRRALDLPRFFKEKVDLDESPSYLYGWLAGYVAADGHVTKDGRVEIDSNTPDHLEHVRAVCNLLGIHTTTIRTKPSYGGGYTDAPGYAINFDRGALTEEFFIIEEHRHRWVENRDKQQKDYRGHTVVSVEHTDRVEEVFCASVPGTHSFVLEDNILTGNSYRDNYYEDNASLLGMELKFLSEINGRVERQKIGPVTTKDLCDAFCVVVSDLLHTSLERYGAGDDLVTGLFGSTSVTGLRSGRDQERMVSAGVVSERAADNRARLAGWREERARARYSPDRRSSIHRRDG